MSNIPQSGDIAEIISGEDLIKIIECPICKSTPYPPIYGCTAGHICCNECRPKLQHCGVCRQPFWQGRNYIMESILLGSKFHCNYQNLGCKEIILGNDLKKHLMACPFGPMSRESAIIIPPSPLFQWIPCSNGVLPENAVAGGRNETGDILLYVARASHEGSKIPGSFNMFTKKAHIPCGGEEYVTSEYEILVGRHEFLTWEPCSNGYTPPSAIPGGVTRNGNILFIGRCEFAGTLSLGSIEPNSGGCLVPFNGNDYSYPHYEVLVRNIGTNEPLGMGAHTRTSGWNNWSD